VHGPLTGDKCQRCAIPDVEIPQFLRRLPDAVAVDAMVLGTGFTRVTADGVEHIPHERVTPVTTDHEPMPPDAKPAVSLFDDDEDDVVEVLVGTVINVIDVASDKPRRPATTPDAAPPNEKTDRKTYLREYMRARRQREREEAQRVVEAGTGATDQ
jgi:hypothetical protein